MLVANCAICGRVYNDGPERCENCQAYLAYREPEKARAGENGGSGKCFVYLILTTYLITSLVVFMFSDGGNGDIWQYIGSILGTSLIYTILICVGIGFLLLLGQIQEDAEKPYQTALNQLPNFKVTQKYLPTGAAVYAKLGNTAGMAIDQQSGQICFLTKENNQIRTQVIGKRDLIASEVVEDGHSITKISTSNIATRALVGGLLLGPAGAIIGGVTARKSSVNEVSERVELWVTVNDPSKPFRTIRFLNGKHKKDSSEYKNAIAQAKKWHKLISTLIQHTDQELVQISPPQVVSAPPHVVPTTGVVEELQKLEALRASGVINEDEFNTLKSKAIQRA